MLMKWVGLVLLFAATLFAVYAHRRASEPVQVQPVVSPPPVASSPMKSRSPSPAQVLSPPLGFVWGRAPGSLLQWAQEHDLKARVLSSTDGSGLTNVVVTARSGLLPGQQADSLAGRFYDGKLCEISLHYSFPGRPAAHAVERFQEMKEALTARYGSFRETPARHEDRGGVSITSHDHVLQPSGGSELVMTLTTALDHAQGGGAAAFEVSYRNAYVLQGLSPDGSVAATE